MSPRANIENLFIMIYLHAKYILTDTHIYMLYEYSLTAYYANINTYIFIIHICTNYRGLKMLITFTFNHFNYSATKRTGISIINSSFVNRKIYEIRSINGTFVWRLFYKFNRMWLNCSDFIMKLKITGRKKFMFLVEIII